MSEKYEHVNKILNLYRAQKFEEIQALYMKNQVEDIVVGIVWNGTKSTLYIKIGDQEILKY